MAQLGDFGKQVKHRLIDVGMTQSALAAEITERTGLFVDSGYLHKIYTGERSAPKIVSAICEILELTEPGA